MARRLGIIPYTIDAEELGINWLDGLSSSFGRDQLPEHLKPLFDNMKAHKSDKAYLITLKYGTTIDTFMAKTHEISKYFSLIQYPYDGDTPKIPFMCDYSDEDDEITIGILYEQ